VKKYAKLLWFACIGGAATVAYALLAYVMTKSWGWQPVLASAIAYSLCALGSFLGHKFLTFKSSAPASQEAHRFVLTTAIGYALALAVPFFVTQTWLFDARISIVMVCILSPTLNYILLNYFVFKPRANTA